MLIRWTFVALLTAAGLATAASPGVAQQNYPNRPVRIIVGFQPGSSVHPMWRRVWSARS
jgi:tripartite-type tricarboxylate transporter receptor subunit TctC